MLLIIDMFETVRILFFLIRISFSSAARYSLIEIFDSVSIGLLAQLSKYETNKNRRL
jgi:hypothetical protein